jgi:hypothetical protein
MMRPLSFCLLATIALGTHASAQDRPSLFSQPNNAAPSTPTVLCGTTIIPANPKVDPKAIRPAPRGNFTLRLAQPTACAPRSSALRDNIGNRLPQISGPRR